jgi:hypothetical protein
LSWLELDDGILDHPKFIRAVKLGGSEAIHLWLGIKAYCGKQLTDGLVPEDMLDEVRGPRDPKKRAAALVALKTVGLLDPAEGGVRMHNYLKHSKSREQILAMRKQARDRQARSRSSHAVTDAVTDTVTTTTSHGAAGCGGGVVQGSGSDLEATEPESARDPDSAVVAAASPLVPCPPDLALTDGQRSALKLGSGMNDYQIDQLQLSFKASACSSQSDRRSLDAWRKCMAKAVAGDFSHSRRRPASSPDAPETDDQARRRLRSGPRQPNKLDHSTPEAHLRAIGATEE